MYKKSKYTVSTKWKESKSYLKDNKVVSYYLNLGIFYLEVLNTVDPDTFLWKVSLKVKFLEDPNNLPCIAEGTSATVAGGKRMSEQKLRSLLKSTLSLMEITHLRDL
jgi:hypothetical protein